MRGIQDNQAPAVGKWISTGPARPFLCGRSQKMIARLIGEAFDLREVHHQQFREPRQRERIEWLKLATTREISQGQRSQLVVAPFLRRRQKQPVHWLIIDVMCAVGSAALARGLFGGAAKLNISDAK